MRALVDTSVWSLALRRAKSHLDPSDTAAVGRLAELVREGLVVMIGPIRQELLSGISDEARFHGLKDRLRAFEDLDILAEDHELAAEFFNACRKRGIQGSHTDFLICAVAAKHKLRVFTLDKDFERSAKPLGIDLMSVES
jgi:predicted nucleic acid-binding protein